MPAARVSVPLPGFGVYCSTKLAVEGISEALHAELAPLEAKHAFVAKELEAWRTVATSTDFPG
jgi:NAD(P)-dependent dehydrogenase (short-subunit alcohol dehydrogenase family)